MAEVYPVVLFSNSGYQNKKFNRWVVTPIIKIVEWVSVNDLLAIWNEEDAAPFKASAPAPEPTSEAETAAAPEKAPEVKSRGRGRKNPEPVVEKDVPVRARRRRTAA